MPSRTPAQPRKGPSASPPAARWPGFWSVGRLGAIWGPLVLLVLVWSFWRWSGAEGSLASALTWANRALPMGHHLITSGVQGNLRQGGQVRQLEWRSPGLQAQAQDTHIALDWSLLWRQPWPVQSLHTSSLHIVDQRPAKPRTPWTSLKWPLPVQMAFKIDRLHWQGANTTTLSDVQAHYAYDGHAHTLKVPRLTLAQGQYSLQGRLQGAAPMALDLEVKGQIQTPAHGSTSSQVLALSASVQGTLSGPEALLSLNAQMAPVPAQGPRNSEKNPVHLALQADVRPWPTPAVMQAKGQWQGVDLALLWPRAPHTQLTGHAQLQPEGADWSLQAELRNLQPGAWDLDKLPLSRLSLTARQHQGLWQVLPSQAQVAGGFIQARAQQSATGWTGDLGITGLLPGQLHTALVGAPIQGQLKVTETDHGPIRFDAQLQAPAPPTRTDKKILRRGTASGFDFEQLHLAGHWQQQVWQIDNLKLKARQATLNGHFSLSPDQPSLQGQWTLETPGVRAQAQGQLAPDQGQGELLIDVLDASAAWTWWNHLPAWQPLSLPLQASGQGQLKAQWQGGFARADTSVQLDLLWPRLAWSTGAGLPWRMDRGQLKVVGTPLSWQAQAQSLPDPGQASSPWQLGLSAARPHMQSHQWRGQLERLELQTFSPYTQAPWGLQLQKAVPWQVQLDRAKVALAWSEAHWHVLGPTPGRSRLQIEAGQWHGARPGQPARAQIAARWDDLPLNWLLHETGTALQNDVLLQAELQFTQNADTTLTAQIRRSQGDLRLQIDPTSGQPTAAGVQDASLKLRIHNDQLQADAKWDSLHMGQAQGQVLSTLSHTLQGWQWPANAPLRGSVQARLPQIGVWSVLAPPGWRVQGNLDARLDLAGTLGQPQWQGQLQADQLAVRSAVQGVAFDQGRMQARLQGQTLILDLLSLRGAGPQGGEFLARGQAHLAQSASRTPAPNAHPLHAVRMILDMEAKSLRVSNRADRRLALSGQVTARMQAGQMQVSGALKADQALFLLPEETTPSLGDDVVIVRPATGPRLGSPAAPLQTTSPSWVGVPDVRVMLDLGPDFQLRGKGLSTRLSGQLELVSQASTQGSPRLSGQVHTVGGRYQAYGQPLNIRTGILRFNGAYDNPGLEILALRPNLPQSVGVQVSGSALQPRIRLYADPEMPDGDKLAWLVLGRSAASGGVESAMLQQAAMVLLGGDGKTLSSELASRLGLDEISLSTGARSGSTTTAAAVTLGKRLSQDFYLAYETGLSGTLGSLFIFYDLTQRLTLRAQAGEQSALDMIFRIRRD